MSGDSTPDTNINKKRYMSSPYESIDSKKTRVLQTMEGDTNTSNFSFSEDDLVKIAEILKSYFQHEINILTKMQLASLSV
jgi:hypothetical protein